jgi:hypothetical protein
VLPAVDIRVMMLALWASEDATNGHKADVSAILSSIEAIN